MVCLCVISLIKKTTKGNKQMQKSFKLNFKKDQKKFEAIVSYEIKNEDGEVCNDVYMPAHVEYEIFSEVRNDGRLGGESGFCLNAGDDEEDQSLEYTAIWQVKFQ